MALDDDGLPRYVRLVTAQRCVLARQVASYQGGRLLLFALVDPAGHDLGQAVLAERSGLRLEPVMLANERQATEDARSGHQPV